MATYISLVFSSFIFSLLELFTTLRKEKWFKIIQFSFIVVLFILYAFNRNNIDYENYQKMFIGEMDVAEKGYLFLNRVVKYLGGTYNFIPLILGGGFIFCIFYLYKIEYPISFIFLYSMMSFSYDVNQIRNLFCSVFILIAIYNLIKDRKNIYKIFNIIAFFFQRLGIVYFLFYILNKFKLNNYKKIVFTMFLVIVLSINTFPYFIKIFIPDKINYLDKRTHFSPLAYLIYLLVNLLILKLSKSSRKINTKEEVFVKFIFFPWLFLPSAIFFLEIIVRIVRFSNYIKWIYFFNYIKKREKIGNCVLIFTLLTFQEIFLWAVGMYSNPASRIEQMTLISNINFYF